MTDREADRVLAALAGVPYPWARPGVRFRYRCLPQGGWLEGEVIRRADPDGLLVWMDHAPDYRSRMTWDWVTPPRGELEPLP